MSRPLHIYSEILPADVYAAEESERPGIVRFLSQGAAVGAFLGLLIPVNSMLSHPENGYNYFFLFFLPSFVLSGIGWGLVEGIILWGCTYMSGHRLNVALRAVLCIAVFAMLWYVVVFFIEPSSNPDDKSGPDYIGTCTFIACGALYGLVVGSRFHPFHELIRGTPDSHHPVMDAITGFALRIAVIVGVMYSVLYLILAQQGEYRRTDDVLATISFTHFVISGVILFTRMPFWLLFPLAIILNFPIAAYVTDVLTERDVFFRALALNYLALWAAFLSCRVSLRRTKRER